MELLDMMRKSQSDFSTFKSIIQAKIDVNETLLDTVANWFENVEIKYPICEMPLTDEERTEIAGNVCGEMTAAVEVAIKEIESGRDEEEVMPKVSSKLDSLWRELAGVYAPILNARFQRVATEVDAEEVLANIRQMVTMMATMSGDDEESVRARMRKDEAIRAKLRKLGIDPDTI